MDTKVITCTSKGQITLPKKWRDKFDTNSYLLSSKDNQIIITPIKTENLQEEVIFDADRDNDGKGLDGQEIINVLTKMLDGK